MAGNHIRSSPPLLDHRVYDIRQLTWYVDPANIHRSACFVINIDNYALESYVCIADFELVRCAV